MEIAKAVVLAGSNGGPAWGSVWPRSRHLAPVANKPVLFHALDALRLGGVRAAVLVIDAETGDQIHAAVKDGARLGLDVQYVREAAPRCRVETIRAAADRLGNPPFLVQDADVLLRDDLGTLAREFAHQRLDAMVLDHGMCGRAGETAHGRSHIVGTRVLRAGWPPARDDLVPGSAAPADGMSAVGLRVAVRRTSALLPCREDAASLLAVNRRLLDELIPAPPPPQLLDSRVEGRVIIDPTVRLENTLVRGPVMIGAGSRIVNAYVGPYTSIGPDVQLENVEIEHSIVTEGARLADIAGRVGDSVVGRSARVKRERCKPHTVRLTIGDGAEIALA